jgi:NAD(P)-dependent dehydrogenase (short-subunit alcohol dehydrogenase family)
MGSRLENKIAIVTGAGSVGPGWGNGRAIAARFAEEGAKIFAVDLHADRLVETENAAKADLRCHLCDVTDGKAVAAMVQACLDHFGRVDILVNNVGGSAPGGPVEMAEEVWDAQVDYNLKSVFLGCKHVLPVMERQGGGAIVNISSIASLRFLGVAYASYSASKAAMNHLTRTTAAEYAGRNIRVNAVLPGLMKTPMVERSAGLAKSYGAGDVEAMWRARDAQVPMGRMGDAWDVAHAALFLASDEARYITATEIVVDGGLTAATR